MLTVGLPLEQEMDGVMGREDVLKDCSVDAIYSLNKKRQKILDYIRDLRVVYIIEPFIQIAFTSCCS